VAEESGIRTHGTVRLMTDRDKFRTRNDLSGTERRRSIFNENKNKSTKPAFVLPLVTIWLQIRVLAGPAFRRVDRPPCREPPVGVFNDFDNQWNG
jgi:hypothetical protein